MNLIHKFCFIKKKKKKKKQKKKKKKKKKKNALIKNKISNCSRDSLKLL